LSDPGSDVMASPPPAVHHAPPPAVAPYHPPPPYPPPVQTTQQVTDGRAAASLVLGILGLIFSIPLGLPGMVAGPTAYFLGKNARARIAESKGQLGGEGAANLGRILGVIATVVGCLFGLLWLIVIFNALLDLPVGE
jgi:hypothetical protein